MMQARGQALRRRRSARFAARVAHQRLQARGDQLQRRGAALSPRRRCPARRAAAALGAFVGVGVTGEALVLGQGAAGRRAVAPLGEVAIDHPRALAALVDRPHDQRLPAAGVAGGEHALHRGRVGLDGLDVAARVLLHAELVEQLLLGVQEAHRQQHELRRQLALGARRPGANGGVGLGLGDVQRGHAAVAVAGEVGRGDRVVLLADARRRAPPPSRS